MISEFEQIFAGSESYFEESEGQVFTWNGVEYQCNAAELSSEEDFSNAGLRRRRSVQIFATVAQFAGDLPQPTDPIQYLGESYVVDPEYRVDAVALHFRAYVASG